MTREQQKLRINRIRRAIIAGATASSLAVAGYLGLSTQTSTATAASTDTGTSTTGTSGTTGTSDSTTFSSRYGDNSTQLGTGSGSSQAVTSGS